MNKKLLRIRLRKVIRQNEEMSPRERDEIRERREYAESFSKYDIIEELHEKQLIKLENNDLIINEVFEKELNDFVSFIKLI